MPSSRIRTIKPEFWTDEKISECSMTARLLFIASWNFADDKGGLERSAKQLKAQAFPYDNIDCEPFVQELLRIGLFIEYAVNGKNYLHIKNFLKHQLINRPSNPRVPVYEDTLSSARVLSESSQPDGKGSEGKGKELNGSERKGEEVKGSKSAPASVIDAGRSEPRKLPTGKVLTPQDLKDFAKLKPDVAPGEPRFPLKVTQ